MSGKEGGGNSGSLRLKEMPDKYELKEMLVDHQAWIDSKHKTGHPANFSGIKFRDKINFRKDILSLPPKGTMPATFHTFQGTLNLTGVNFQNSQLCGVEFGKDTLLHDANFFGANLKEAKFTGLELRGADFRNAKLSDTQFNEAKLQNAKFQNVTGVSTNFESADLQNAQFQDACLQTSPFGHELNFRNTDLSHANFSGATLRGADLLGADLLGAIFQEAYLRDARIQDEVKGISERQFAGADLTGARLPSTVEKFEGLSNVEEVTKSGRKLFVWLMMGCVYALLTIIGTKTESFLTDSADFLLPIFQTKVQILALYQFSPLVLLFVYLWLHLYLQKNYWSRLAMLPAYFPEGTKIDERIFPWHFGGFILHNFPHLRDMPSFFVSKAQYVLSILCFWCVVPIMIGYFWLTYLPIHDLYLTTVCFLISVISGWAFLVAAIKTVQRKQDQGFFPFLWHSASKWVRLTSLLLAVCCFAVLGVSYGAYVGYLTQARFVADLKGVNLSGLNLARVNLRNADLTDTRIEGTNLQGAFLEGAKLVRVRADSVELMGARLNGADMTDMLFYSAKLQGADLRNSTLTRVDFSFSHLNGVRFDGAWLEAAKLENSSEVGYDMIKNAKTLFETFLRPSLRDSIRAGLPHLLERPAAQK